MEKFDGFSYAKKIIVCSMQDEETAKKIIDFNKKNNYEYEITESIDEEEGNLIDSRCLMLFIRNGYKLREYGSKIWLKHKKLIEKEEENE